MRPPEERAWAWRFVDHRGAWRPAIGAEPRFSSACQRERASPLPVRRWAEGRWCAGAGPEERTASIGQDEKAGMVAYHLERRLRVDTVEKVEGEYLSSV